jgi:hypothetical protein
MIAPMMKMRTFRTFRIFNEAFVLVILAFSFSAFAASDPWDATQLVQPEGLAQSLKSSPNPGIPLRRTDQWSSRPRKFAESRGQSSSRLSDRHLLRLLPTQEMPERSPGVSEASSHGI